MKKIISKIVFVAVIGLTPVMTSCQGLVDAVLGTEDQPTTTPVHISGISISGEGIVDGELKINGGLTLQLTATVSPADTQETEVKWTSSDDAVVTVSSEGLITAVKAGTAVVKVTSSVDATKYASVTVYVSEGALKMNDEPVDQSQADSRG